MTDTVAMRAKASRKVWTSYSMRKLYAQHNMASKHRRLEIHETTATRTDSFIINDDHHLQMSLTNKNRSAKHWLSREIPAKRMQLPCVLCICLGPIRGHHHVSVACNAHQLHSSSGQVCMLALRCRWNGQSLPLRRACHGPVSSSTRSIEASRGKIWPRSAHCDLSSKQHMHGGHSTYQYSPQDT
jgi:hypothetical protein